MGKALTMAARLKLKGIILAALFVVINLAILLGLSCMSSPSADRKTDEKPLGIFANSDTNLAGVSLTREETVKFALDQHSSLIKYLFAAAAAILTILSKILVEPFSSKDETARYLPLRAFWKFYWGALFALSSLMQGAFGLGELAKLSNQKAWSLSGPSGLYIAMQEIFLFVSVATIFVGIVYLIAESQEETTTEDQI